MFSLVRHAWSGALAVTLIFVGLLVFQLSVYELTKSTSAKFDGAASSYSGRSKAILQTSSSEGLGARTPWIRKLQTEDDIQLPQAASESAVESGALQNVESSRNRESGTPGKGLSWWKYVQQLGGWQNYIDLIVATNPRIHYQANKPHYPRASTTPNARELENRLAASVRKRGGRVETGAVADLVLEDHKFEKGSGEFLWFSGEKPKRSTQEPRRIIDDELQEMVNARLHRRGFLHGVKKPEAQLPEDHVAKEGNRDEKSDDFADRVTADTGFSAWNVSQDPGLVGGFVSVCGETCTQYGTCNEELARCDCPWDRAGKDCSEVAMPECQISENRTTSCNQPGTCACYLRCEEYGFGHNHACFDSGPPYKSEEAVWNAPQVVMRSDGHGHEIPSVKVTLADGDPNFAKVLPSEYCPLGCSNVGWCERDGAANANPPSGYCNCPFGFTGPGCEVSEKRRDVRISCLNDCSGRGSCNRGFCHCKPGAFGIDCSLSRGTKPGDPSLVFTNPGTLLETGSEARGQMQKEEQSWIYTYEQSRRAVFMAKKKDSIARAETGFANPLFIPSPPPSPSPPPPPGVSRAPRQGAANRRSPGGARFEWPVGLQTLSAVQPMLIEIPTLEEPLEGDQTENLPQGGENVGQKATPSLQQGPRDGEPVVNASGQPENRVNESTKPGLQIGTTSVDGARNRTGEGQMERVNEDGQGVTGGVNESGQGEGLGDREEESRQLDETESTGALGNQATESAGLAEGFAESDRLDEGFAGQGVDRLGFGGRGSKRENQEEGDLISAEQEEVKDNDGDVRKNRVQRRGLRSAKRFQTQTEAGIHTPLAGILSREGGVEGGVKRTLLLLAEVAEEGIEFGLKGETKEELPLSKEEGTELLGDPIGEDEIPFSEAETETEPEVDKYQLLEDAVIAAEELTRLLFVTEGPNATLTGNGTPTANGTQPGNETWTKNGTQSRNGTQSGNGIQSRNGTQSGNGTQSLTPYRTLSVVENEALYLNLTVQNMIEQETRRWAALQEAYPNNTKYMGPPRYNISALYKSAEVQLQMVKQAAEMQEKVRRAKAAQEKAFIESLGHVRNKTRGRGAAQPLIYVYELPPHLNTWTYVHSVGADRTAPLICLERLLHSPHRTTDFQLADFFFVPAWPRWHLNRGPYLESVVRYINATWPFFSAKQGRDHIWFTTDDWGPCEETGLRNRVIGDGILLTFWGYDKNARNEGDHPCFIPGQDIVVPPNLEFNILQKRMEAERKGKLAVGVKNRTTWFYFAGSSGRLAESTGTGRKEYSFGVRQAVFDEFEDDARFKLEEFRWDASDYLSEMSDALFCLAPSGHGWGTRATQAVVLGCIPVVIQDNVTQPFEYDLIDWESFGVRIKNEDVPRIPEILGAIHVEDIERKQRIMAEVWPRFLWQSPSEGPLEVVVPGPYKERLEELFNHRDAFSTTMEVLRQRLEMED